MRILAFLLASALTVPLFADAADDVRRAETAFAKAFADRDKAKFFAFVADDATFLSPAGTLRGKAAVVERWSRFFEGPVAPFSWGPDRVSVTTDGTIGLSSGPVFAPDGSHAGTFSSTWRRQADGSWKIIFDGSGPGPAVFAADAVPYEEGDIPTPDGVRLHYRKFGRGPFQLIAPFDVVLYEPMKTLADIATVVTYDMRSRGRSSRAENVNTLTIDQDVQDLETVRAHFKMEKFTPVGFSYLGKMVMLYAAAHPDRVRRIIQLAPAANREGAEEKEIPSGAPQELVDAWQKAQREGAMEKTPREFCLTQWNALRYWLVGDPKNASRVTVEPMCALENEWPVNVNRVFEKLIPSMNAHVLSDAELKSIAAPVLTIHGQKDRNASYGGGRAWAAQLPNARLVTLPNAAHAVWLDNPVETLGAIRAFLRGDEPLGSER
ncbi:MAG: alpha/beta fold hydrolase [Acidobacteriota bacterium]|nr:alpha/beta fold hydrolase [Acidobacteriota bacterium]